MIKRLPIKYDFKKLEKKLPLEKFIPAAFVIFLLCIFILSVITYSLIGRYNDEIEWINNSNEVIKRLHRINVQLLEIPLLRRGFVLTGDKVYLPSLDSIIEKNKAEILNLRNLATGDSERGKLISQLDSLSKANAKLINSSILNYEAGKDYQVDPAQVSVTRNVQKNLDNLKEIIEQLKDKERHLLKERTEVAQNVNSMVQNFIIFTSIFSFLIIGLSLYISDKLIKNKNEAEQLLYNSYEELEEKVEERTLELKESNEKLINEIAVRKRTEEILRESEQRFRVMADSAPVLVWISGVDKLCTYFNKVWLEFTGRTMEQELGNGWAEGVHPDDLQRCLDIYTTSFDNRKPFEMEYRLRSANGEYKWILDKGVALYEGDKFAGYIGSCIEIDSRKKNETFLKIQYSVSKTLADAKTVKETYKGVLENICSGINWDFGILWAVDKSEECFSVESIWSSDVLNTKEYSEIYNKLYRLPKDKGLPGSVLIEKKAKWLKDISTDKTFIRKEAAAKMGWNSGLGIPISNGEDVIAIIECFNKKSLVERLDLIEVLESAGRQIGNFMERKKAEEKLKKSYAELEEKVNERTMELATTLNKLLNEIQEKEKIQSRIRLFAHAIRGIKESVYITDLDNNTLFINEAFQKNYGFTEEEIIGKEIPILSHNNLTPNLKDDIIKRTAMVGWKGELVTSRKDGSTLFTFLSTSTIRNDEGKIEAIVGICQDITELKKAEEIINKRNSLLYILNDIIRFTNRTFDLNKAIQYSINKVCQYTTWDVGHCFIKKSDVLHSSKIWNEDLSEKYFALKDFTENITFRKGEGTPGQTFETGKSLWVRIEDLKDIEKYKRAKITRKVGLKTGIWVPIIMQNTAIGVLEFFKKDEDPLDVEVLEIINNIGIELGSLCEKLETIDKIRESEKLLNDAQHIAKLGSWEWDVINNTVSWSDEMYSIYELKKEQFDPTYEGFLELVHKDDVEKVKMIIQNAFINKTQFNFFHRIITPSGMIKTLKAQGEIYLNETGDVIRMFGTGHDISDIREAEEKLERTNEKLIETQKELIYNEKLAALGRFSSGVAHEIRNPLANISSLAQMVVKADIDEKSKKRLKYILTNAEIANQIIKNLLSFASPAELVFNYENLDRVLNNILESIEARANEKNIKIIKEITGLPVLCIDKLRLENAIMNFVSNSIEAMPGGGVLSIKAFENENNNEVIIFIADTGIGIPQENIDKILEPFFTTKDNGVGLGMGLAHQTIKLHNGTFHIHSTEGKGTCIEIRLPIRNINLN